METAADWDVVVCGGGPAGCAAAVMAARRGARTLLLERYAHLGGMATGARVSCFCDSPGGPVFDEVLSRLTEVGAAAVRVDRERYRDPGRHRYEPEMVKAVLMEMVMEAGAKVLLETLACDAVLQGNRVGGVRAAGKGGVMRFHASVTIDATADADIAAAAGAAFLKGDPADGRLQHCNYRWNLGGVDWQRFKAAAWPVSVLADKLRAANRDGRLRAPAAIFGVDPAVFPLDAASGELRFGNWELQQVDPTDPVQVSQVVGECQVAALRLVRYCRRELPGFENCRIDDLAATLGTRESRRIVGRCQVTGADVLAGTKHPDAVAPAWFWIDLHDPPPGRSIPYGLPYIKAHQPPPGDWYEIPYRSLLPAGVDGLIVAGRCISCDRPALGSLRVMPTCMFIGAGAGLAAAMAVGQGLPPHAIDGEALSRALRGSWPRT